MTENKRYYKENFYDEYAIKKEDTLIAIVDSGSNAKKICDELNELHERIHELEKENITIKNTIKEAMENERTHLGYNTLKQLAENLKVKIK